MGYLKNEKATRETLDAEGYIHSGDLGRVDEDYYLQITGRKKELIITSGGENIAPVPIEDLIKTSCPVVSNAVLIGDERKYLTALITMQTEVKMENGVSKPTTLLAQEVRTNLRAMRCEAITSEEAARDSKVLGYI